MAAFLIVPSQWAARNQRNKFDANIGYADTLRNQHCDILIAGDSSALVGVEPAILTQRTGLSACNIADLEGLTTVLGTGMLDDYLSRNSRPRYLVFVYSPDNFSARRGWPGDNPGDAVTYMVRTRRTGATAGKLLRHPLDAIDTFITGLRIFARDYRKPALTPDEWQFRASHAGWFEYPQVPAERCPSGSDSATPDKSWVDGLRQRYTSPATSVSPHTQVLFLSIPVPVCDGNLAFHRRAAEGTADNGLETYPEDEFHGGDGGFHLIHPGVESFSAEIADRIAALQAANPPQKPGER